MGGFVQDFFRMRAAECRERHAGRSLRKTIKRSEPRLAPSIYAIWGSVGVGDGDLTGVLVQGIPDSQHVHDAQGAVVQAVAGTDGAGAFVPQVTAMPGTE